MNQVLELNKKLTDEELKQVKNFAHFLISRRASTASATARQKQPQYIDVDALAGMCAGMGGDKTDVELAQEATEIRAAKFGT